jgi:hypothetical protein
MKILSIDFDFFLPDLAPYDWSHNEAGLFYEMIWLHRVDSRNIFTGVPAIQEVRPSIPPNFWKRVLRDKPKSLLITDSHLDLYRFCEVAKQLVGAKGIDITNLDQHHDCGYYDNEEKPNCGNWVSKGTDAGLIGDYYLFYPEWRKGNEEDGVEECDYGLPEPDTYDTVFICRSSCWTPTWCDSDWLSFIHHFRNYPKLWKNATIAPFVRRARTPNLAQARALYHIRRKENEELLKQGMVNAVILETPEGERYRVK